MIRIEDLAVGYNKKPVFSRLSFSASSKNSPIILAGRNGSGKSSLLKAIAGFIKPISGKIEFESEQSRIAWLPQHFRIALQIPVLDFVCMGCEKAGKILSIRPDDARTKSIDALQRLGIEALADKNTEELSGGEWQLVCLAQMLVQDANIWLLDEPTASLDIGHKRKVLNLLWEEAKGGKTIILSTHDLPFLPESGGSFLFVSDKPEFFPNLPEERKALIQKLENL